MRQTDSKACATNNYTCTSRVLFYSFILEILFYRKEGRVKETERNISVWLPLACSLLGTWPATQACAMTGNRTSNLLLHRSPLIHWATPARACFILKFRGFYFIFDFICDLKNLNMSFVGNWSFTYIKEFSLVILVPYLIIGFFL